MADTSIWVDHFRAADTRLNSLYESSQLIMHPYIIGELAMGSMKNPKRILQDLNDLVTVLPVRHADVMTMIENRELYGTGLQYIDAHLLAATLVTDGCKLWTRDKRLHDAAEKLGVAA